MKINNAGLELIKVSEGLRLNSYLCPAGVPTIGYGHTKNVKMGTTIAPVEAVRLLQEDVAEFEKAIAHWAATVHIPLNENEFAALVSFAFNIGVSGFTGSTAARKLKEGDRFGAANALLMWNKGDNNAVLPGLVRRRKAERELFLRKVGKI